ncbi:MAG TPA: universal stress protein [Streptosporangiaceae bacterium]|nr:universal stress protein [Streptosporangiaceae bacterium]
MMDSHPLIIGFDGTPRSERAIREAAGLFAPRAAVVAVVWEAGRSFEAATLSVKALELPKKRADVGTAFEAERSAFEAAQQLADRGATLARQAGLDAEGLAVADDAAVAETLARLAREQEAIAVVIGDRPHGDLRRLVLGSTLTGLLRRAPCPVVVCGSGAEDS